MAESMTTREIEMEQVSDDDLMAGAAMYDALVAGTFYADHDAAVRAMGGEPRYIG